MKNPPVIILGAGRSGTNILRDTLTRLPGYKTWDCDEINLVWRHGNLDREDDVFGAAHATPEVTRYMNRTFETFERRSGADVVVEKTCANTLRVPFIRAVFPQARFVHIVRDGRDVTLSAMQRWTASIEPAYLLKKLRYAPLTDVPHYGLRFIRNRLHQRQSAERRQKAWGPIFPGMAEWVSHRPLVEVCARQWATCVEQADQGLQGLPPSQIFALSYEDLVTSPAKVLERLCNWLQPGMASALPGDAVSAIRAGRPDAWRSKENLFTPAALEILAPTLVSHGYASSN
jgi:hypothetical protein